MLSQIRLLLLKLKKRAFVPSSSLEDAQMKVGHGGRKKQQGMVREKAKHDNKAMKTKPVCHIPCCPDNSGNTSLTESFKTYLTVPKLCSPVQTGPRATLG